MYKQAQLQKLKRQASALLEGSHVYITQQYERHLANYESVQASIDANRVVKKTGHSMQNVLLLLIQHDVQAMKEYAHTGK